MFVIHMTVLFLLSSDRCCGSLLIVFKPDDIFRFAGIALSNDLFPFIIDREDKTHFFLTFLFFIIFFLPLDTILFL